MLVKRRERFHASGKEGSRFGGPAGLSVGGLEGFPGKSYPAFVAPVGLREAFLEAQPGGVCRVPAPKNIVLAQAQALQAGGGFYGKALKVHSNEQQKEGLAGASAVPTDVPGEEGRQGNPLGLRPPRLRGSRTTVAPGALRP